MISLRDAITNRAHAGVRASTSMPAFDRKRSTCLTPCRGLISATSAYAAPIAWTAARGASIAPSA